MSQPSAYHSNGAPAPGGWDEELYGKLLEAEADLEIAGGYLIFFYLLLAIFACCAIWFDWYRALAPLEGVDLHSFWVYALVIVALSCVWLMHFEFVQRLCYQRHRGDILDQVGRVGIKRYRLLARVQDLPALKNIAQALKRDRWDDSF